MKCEELGELLPDYIQGDLAADQRILVEQHLKECAQCADEVNLWNKLTLLPELEPNPRMRARFTGMLEAYQEGQAARSRNGREWYRKLAGILFGGVWRAPVSGLVWAVLFLAIGLLAGRSLWSSGPANPNEGQISQLTNEVANMRQLLVLSLLQQQSASERLQAVSMSMQEPQADPKVLSALLHTLRYDNSVNVRLAALDALSRYQSRPDVRKGLRDALQPQQSPMVQVALIDLMVELRDTSVVQQLKAFEQDPSVNPTVRQRAAWGVKKLT